MLGRTEELIARIAMGSSVTTGAGFFQALVEHLANALGADYALVAEVVPDHPDRARTLAVFAGGSIAANFEYALPDTPCANIVNGSLCVYPKGIKGLFPKDPKLLEMGADACAGTPLFDSKGRVLGLMAVLYRRPLAEAELVKSVLEIFAARVAAELERQQADEALRRSEHRYREFISHSTEGVWRIEFDPPIPLDLPEDILLDRVLRHSYIAEANDRIAQMNGFASADQVVGLRIIDFVGASEPRIEQIKEHARGGFPAATFQFRSVDRNGKVWWLERHDVPIVENGRLLRVWGTTRDITASKRDRAALQESEKRYHTLFEAAGDAIFLSRDCFIDCNTRALEMFGATREQIIGQQPWHFSPEYQADGRSSQEKALEKMALALRGQTVTFEWRHCRLDGSVFDSEVTLSPVSISGVVHRLALVKDITKRKQAEAELAALNRERVRMLNQRSTLLDINNAVVANLDRESLFRAIFDAVRRTLPCDGLLLTLRDPETGLLHTTALAEDGIEQAIAAAPGPSEWVLEHRVPLLRADLTRGAQASCDNAMLAQGFQSYLSAPLQAKGEPFGALTLVSKARRGLTSEGPAFFTQVCRQVSLAVENMLSFEQIARLKARLERENAYLIEEIKSEHNFEEMVGSSAPFLALIDRIQRVAPTDATVLITGETGTGKELVARALHSRSQRRHKPLVKVNCAAISAGLVESELFGHVKGAFTGALDRRVGRFEFADGGTLFLDEVGELPLETQSKLLRVLQEHEFEPVGSNQTVPVDVRVIAATNRRLEEAVREGRFRADLFFRLHVVPIELPALRERRSDIPALVSSVLANCQRQFGRRIESVAEETMERLLRYDWPGNIRELENVIARAVVLSNEPLLRLGDDLLPPPPPAPAAANAGAVVQASKTTPEPTLEDVEKDHIRAVLERVDWVIQGPHGAATVLGLHPNTLRSRMKKLNIHRPHAIS